MFVELSIDQVNSERKINQSKDNAEFEPPIRALELEYFIDGEEPDHWYFMKQYKHWNNEVNSISC